MRLRNQPEPLSIDRDQHNGWVDFYLGQARHQPNRRCSLLDSHLKIGIHYLIEDASRIRRRALPEEMPPQIWQQLQKKLSRQP